MSRSSKISAAATVMRSKFCPRSRKRGCAYRARRCARRLPAEISTPPRVSSAGPTASAGAWSTGESSAASSATSPRAGVASLGVRPTITASGRSVLEVHLFDFSADLYGAHMRVEFLHKIRDEEKYSDLDALKAQIGRDCEAVRTFLLESRNV